MGGEHGGLPDLTLLLFAIAHQGVDLVGFGIHLRSQSHAAGCGETLSQRTSGNIHTGGFVHIRVALQGAAQLPQVELKLPDTPMGRDSQQSIRGGIMLGYAGLVDSIIKRTEDEIGEKLWVIATGGLSQTISPLIPRLDLVDGLHTLKGLSLIASLNK